METRPVNMRIPTSTLEKIDKIQEMQEINRTQAVTLCVNIAHAIIENMDSGCAVYLEKKDGSRERLIFVM
jgi:hypothetical protein